MIKYSKFIMKRILKMKTMVFDVGGTAIKSAICENGVLFDIRETPTDSHLGGGHIMELLKTLVKSYMELHTFNRIGVSATGQVNSDEGYIKFSNGNIPMYTGLRIKDILESEFLLPTAVENDVNAAALGEAVYGAAKGIKDFICLTYGTGVGGAIFENGKLYHGSSYSAGEIGAMVTHPGDRHPKTDIMSGCYERYASATALVKRASNFDSSLSSGREIFRRFNEPVVRKIVDEWIDEIVYGLVSVVHIFNPSAIILGGGVMEQEYVTKETDRRLHSSIMESFRDVEIKKAALGNGAGLLGASLLFQN